MRSRPTKGRASAAPRVLDCPHRDAVPLKERMPDNVRLGMIGSQFAAPSPQQSFKRWRIFIDAILFDRESVS